MPSPKLSTVTESATRSATRKRAVKTTDPTGRIDIALEKLLMKGAAALGSWLGAPELEEELAPLIKRGVRDHITSKPMFTARQLKIAQAAVVKSQQRGAA